MDGDKGSLPLGGVNGLFQLFKAIRSIPEYANTHVISKSVYPDAVETNIHVGRSNFNNSVFSVQYKEATTYMGDATIQIFLEKGSMMIAVAVAKAIEPKKYEDIFNEIIDDCLVDASALNKPTPNIYRISSK